MSTTLRVVVIEEMGWKSKEYGHRPRVGGWATINRCSGGGKPRKALF